MSSEEISNKIYKILKKEMEGLQSNIREKFGENYNNKDKNWTLKGFDDKNRGYLVFVSSFESQFGNMFENISKEIAKITFGKENVKFVYKELEVNDSDYRKYAKEWSKNSKGYKKKQYIVSKVGSENKGKIVDFLESNTSLKSSKLTPETIPELIEKINYSTEKIFKKEVDLIYFDEKTQEYNIFEIKAGGDLDSGKAPTTVANMLNKYVSLGKTNANLYFATVYNKDGEGNKWTGNVSSILDEEMILIGEEFWNKILPEEITFEEFKEIYYNLFDELNFNEFINDLVKNYRKSKHVYKTEITETHQLSFEGL